MLFFELYVVFFKIGLFSFGGGLAMFPLIQKEITQRAWMTNEQFLDLVSISEMTPGAIAVNSATYVGNQVVGFWGGVAATAGVITPSILIILALATILGRLKGNIYKDAFFLGLKPITVALISYAAYTIGAATFIDKVPGDTGNLISGFSIDFGAVFIGVLAFVILNKAKINPIWTIFLSGFLGVILL